VASPETPFMKGLNMIEIIKILLSFLIGGFIGTVTMCCFQINNETKSIKEKEYEGKKY